MEMDPLQKCSWCGNEFYDLAPSTDFSGLVQSLTSLVDRKPEIVNEGDSVSCKNCNNLLNQMMSARDTVSKCVHNLLFLRSGQVTEAERNNVIVRLFQDLFAPSKLPLPCETMTECNNKKPAFTENLSYLVPVQHSLIASNPSNSGTFPLDNQQELSTQVQMGAPEVKPNDEALTTVAEGFAHSGNGTIIVTINVDLQNGIHLNSMSSSGNSNNTPNVACLNNERKIESDVQISQSSMTMGLAEDDGTEFMSKLKTEELTVSVPSGLLEGNNNILANIINENERSISSGTVGGMDSVGIIPEERLKPKKKARKSHTCTVCSKVCKTLRDLQLHMGVHLQERKFICEVCGLAYRHKKALEVHVALHRGEAKFECEHCHKVFTQKSGLQRHLPIHTGEMAYQCHICGKRFKYNTSFNVHKFTHTKYKEFQCFQCGLSFFSTSHLKRHMKTHTGVKPHACKSCKKCFSERYNLEAHMRIHTGQKSHQCPHCEAGFNRKGKMEEHILQAHTHSSSRVLTS